jgi:4'-phosphopantetheinyl transferase EntD
MLQGPSAVEAALADLVPAPVCWAVVPVEDYSERLFAEERARMARFLPRRVRTFSSGRTAARRALAAAGCPTAEAAIGVLADGAPAAPEGWRLSISHTDEVAVAVACRSDAARTIGVDVEVLARMDLSFRRHVLAPQDSLPEDADAGQLAVVFSLRESLYKALSGRDAQAIVVRWTGERIEAGIEGGPAPRCGYRCAAGHVVSFCLIEP